MQQDWLYNQTASEAGKVTTLNCFQLEKEKDSV